jgi:hypothetical protein
MRDIISCPDVHTDVPYTVLTAFLSPVAIPAPSPHQSRSKRASGLTLFRSSSGRTFERTQRERQCSGIVPGVQVGVDHHYIENSRPS